MCLAVPGRVESVTPADDGVLLGRVGFEGVLREVNLAFVPEVRVGDYVLVHAGFALTIVDEEEALKTFEYLREIDALSEESP